MRSNLFMALAVVSISLTGCTLLNKKATRTPQGGIKSAFKLFVKAGNEAAEALRKGEKEMQGKNLQGAHLQNLDLSDANFRNADLEGARLQGTVWKNTQAQGANFKGARCQGADFGNSFLREENKTTGQIIKAIFKKAKLQKAKMPRFLEDLDFRGANVKEADFTKARVQGADFRGAKNLDEAKWEYTKYSVKTKFPEDFNPQKHEMIFDMEGADLRGQDLSHLDFTKVRNFTDAQLQGCTYNLDQTLPASFHPMQKGMILKIPVQGSKKGWPTVDLKNKDFQDANFEGIHFEEGSDLHGSNLSSVRNLDKVDDAQLKGVFYDLDTKFPRDFVPAEHGMILDLREVNLLDIQRSRGLNGLSQVDLRNAVFGKQNLENVDLYKKVLFGSDLSQVRNLKYVRDLRAAWYDLDTKFPEGFVPADYEMIFNLGDMADLSRLNLQDMDLRNAVFYKSNLSGADFRGKDLSGSHFQTSENLEEARWQGAYYNPDTRFPNGFSPEAHGMIRRQELIRYNPL